MTFLVHYIVKSGVKDLHFDIASSSPVSRSSLDSLRVALARDATIKIGRNVAADDIVVANVIPLPDGRP